IGAVAGSFPEMAYDFAIANRAKIEALLEPGQRAPFFPQLATISRDAATLDKLARYAETIPPSSKGEVEKAAASIRFRLGLIKDRVPEMEQWLAKNGG
ncbi:MAG: M1 family peptidase, partial [Alphaproteobacteria bacterium]